MKIIPFAQELNTGIAGANNGVEQPAPPGAFAAELKAKIMEVNGLQITANEAVEENSIEGASNIHETMIKLEEADVSLRLMGKVRNKAIEAYHELMRMQF